MWFHRTSDRTCKQMKKGDKNKFISFTIEGWQVCIIASNWFVTLLSSPCFCIQTGCHFKE